MLGADIAWDGEIPITSPERTLIDLSPHIGPRARGRMVREAIRLRRTTAVDLLDALDRHRGRRGTAALRELATMYAELPLARARSDAESFALERLVVEIDGPQFHLFPDEDAAKEAAWDAAGYSVERLPSAAIYE